MTLPQYQRQGFGRFLIEFSYLLSKVEGIPGTPEKPLSDLGRVSYHSFWKSVVLEYLDTRRDSREIKISEITNETGVSGHDIATALQLLGFLKSVCEPGEECRKVKIVIDWKKVDVHMAKVKKTSRIKLDPECLRWIPLLTQIPNPYYSPEDGGDTGSETSPIVEPKPVPTIVEKIQKVKIRKKPKGRKSFGQRRSLSMKSKTPQKNTPKEKENKEKENLKVKEIKESRQEKSSVNATLAIKEKQEVELKSSPSLVRSSRGINVSKNLTTPVRIPKTPQTPLLSASGRRMRGTKTPMEPVMLQAITTTPTSSVNPSRKRKHSEKTDPEEEEVSSRKRTRESKREKDKEKERENDKKREKEREREKIEEKEKEKEIKKRAKEKAKEKEKEQKAREKEQKLMEKEKESLKDTPVRTQKTPPKETSLITPTSTHRTVKKQSKLDDILRKVTSRQTKYLQAKLAKEKKEEAALCNGKDEKDLKATNTPTPRRGRTKAIIVDVAKTPDSQEDSSAQNVPELSVKEDSPPPAPPSPQIKKKKSTVSSSLSASHSVPGSEQSTEEPSLQSNPVSTESGIAPIPVETEVPSASPGEYEGGDEDEGEEEEPAPISKPAVQPREDSNISKEKTEEAEETQNSIENETEDQGKKEMQPESESEKPLKNGDPIDEDLNEMREDRTVMMELPRETNSEKYISSQEMVSEASRDLERLEPKESPDPTKEDSPDTPDNTKNMPLIANLEPPEIHHKHEKLLTLASEQNEVTQIHSHSEEKQHSPESGKSTPHLENPGSVKRTPPSQPDLPSMGVYTPDSTTNSVHSLHYGQCDLDVSQLGLESPTSIASDLASQNSVERPPSALPSMQTTVVVPISSSMQISAPPTPVSVNLPSQVQYTDCSMPQHTPPSHVAIHPMHQPHTPQTLQQPRTPQSHTPQSIPTQSPQPIPQSHTPQPMQQSHSQNIPTHSPQPQMTQNHTPQSHTPQPMQLSLQQPQSQSIQSHSQSQQQQQQQQQQSQQSQSHSHSSKRASSSQTTHRYKF